MGGSSGTRLRDNRREVVAGREMETCQGWYSWGPRETAARILRRDEEREAQKREGKVRRETRRGRGEDKERRAEREREKRGEVTVAINRTGTQPVDFSRVTFARERGGEKEKQRRLPQCY